MNLGSQPSLQLIPINFIGVSFLDISGDGIGTLFDEFIFGDNPPPVPEITLLANGVNILDGDTTPSTSDGSDFGTATLGGPTVTHTFTVRNDGDATLTVSLSGLPAGFSVAGLSPQIAPGNSDTFTITLNTTSVGTMSGQISLADNDSNENPFNFSITGTVISTPVTLFQTSHLALPAFAAGAGSWASESQFPRAVADVNGDGRADIVGFGYAGAWVSLATGGGNFAAPFLSVNAFGTAAGGWASESQFPRAVADVNGDGRADIVGFGYAGAWVSLATGGGNFAAPFLSVNAFGTAAGGWASQDQYPRELADVNGDGRADIVGFGYAGAWVSLATGGGNFAAPFLSVNAFGTAAGGWASQDQFSRQLADVNGDGKADIVGFGYAGVWVSLATGGEGHFAQPIFALNAFGTATGGWASQDQYPRELADVNGDGRADIVGFGYAGVGVAHGKSDGTFGQANFDFHEFGAAASAGGWTSDNTYPRALGDLTGDHKADIVGFGFSGIYVAQSQDFGTI